MSKNDFLTIQEFIQKYEVADIRIRRRIRKYKLTDPQKLEGNLSEKYEKGVGNIILLKEDFWAKELEVAPQETAYAQPLKRSDENDQNRLSGTPTAYAQPLKRSPEPLKRSDEFSDENSELITIDKEFLDILKEDRAEKKEWIQKYENLLVDYKAKDNQLLEREKFFQGLVGKVIDDARNTKHLLMSQISHLQKQLQVPKKGGGFASRGTDEESSDGDEIKFENGNFTENNQKEGD